MKKLLFLILFLPLFAFAQQQFTYDAIATGTNTYTCAVTGVASYGVTRGIALDVYFANADTGSPTLQVNSLSAKVINGTIEAGKAYHLVYNLVSGEFDIVGGSGGSALTIGNGLTESLGTVTLGGTTLTDDVNFDGDSGNYGFNLGTISSSATWLSSFQLASAGSTTIFGQSAMNISSYGDVTISTPSYSNSVNITSNLGVYLTGYLGELSVDNNGWRLNASGKSIESDGVGIFLGSNGTPGAGGIWYEDASGYMVELPPATNGNVLTLSSGIPSWQAPSSVSLTTGVTGILPLANGGTNANLTASNGGIFYSTASAGAILSGTATANKMLLSGSSTTPSWSTSTIPTSSGTALKWLRSDGTNYILSTSTLAEGAVTATKILKSDGTNWIASTETYAVPGTSGNVFKSDGTNWTSAAPTWWNLGGTSTLSSAVNVVGTTSNTITYTFDNLGTTLTSGAGLSLVNTTAATVSLPQISPILVFSGYSWNTSGSDSRNVNWMVYSNSHATQPLSTQLVFSSQVNGGGRTNAFTLNTAGAAIFANNISTTNSSGFLHSGSINSSGDTYSSAWTPTTSQTKTTSTHRVFSATATITNVLNLHGFEYNITNPTNISGENYAFISNTGLHGFGTLTPLSTADIKGSMGRDITTVTGTTTLDVTHNVVLVDATSGAITINLPATATNSRRVYTIVKIDSSVNAVTIDGNGSETINGATTKVLATQYSLASISCSSSGWIIIGN